MTEQNDHSPESETSAAAPVPGPPPAAVPRPPAAPPATPQSGPPADGQTDGQTGDPAIDAALKDLADAPADDLDAQVAAGQRVHQTLQSRLSDLGGA